VQVDFLVAPRAPCEEFCGVGRVEKNQPAPFFEYAQLRVVLSTTLPKICAQITRK
jgi:hypothetical protein